MTSAKNAGVETGFANITGRRPAIGAAAALKPDWLTGGADGGERGDGDGGGFVRTGGLLPGPFPVR